MLRTKKVLSVLLALVMVLGVLPLGVFAGNGPIEGGGFIGFILPEYNYDPELPYHIIVYEGDMEVEPIDSASYDKETNTLTLENFDLPMRLNVSSMGDDFKINVVGENSLEGIYINDSQETGCSVTFTGSGSLVVNANRYEDFALTVNANGISRPTVTFDEDVNVTLYALDGDHGGVACVNMAVDDEGDEETPVFIFENGQDVDVQKNDTFVIDGEIGGYVIHETEGYYNWYGKLITSKSDPDGIYTYSECGDYDAETNSWVPTGYSVRKLNEIMEGVYTYDWDFNSPEFETEEQLFTYYTPVIDMITDDQPATLYNRVGRVSHNPSTRIYTDEYDNEYAYGYVYNPDSEEYEYVVCSFAEIPQLPGEYVVTPIDGIDISDLNYTSNTISAYSIGDDGNQGHCGYILDVETPEGCMYTVTNTHHTFVDEPENDYYSWDVHKYVYSEEFEFWFQDYSFNDTGSIEIEPDDWEDSEWNALIYEVHEGPVELKSNKEAEEFYANIYEDAEGHQCAVSRYIPEGEVPCPYDFEEISDGVYLFTRNESINLDDYQMLEGGHVVEGVHDYFIFGQSLEIGASAWTPYVKIVDSDGNEYDPGTPIQIKVGEKKFFWCATDFENNADHGITPFVGFSENYEGATLSPAGFTIKDGTGIELGYADIESFGIEVDTTGMKVTTEAPLNCWLYEFEGKLPDQEGFDWASLKVTNTFTFTFVVAPNEGWNTFLDGHVEYIENGVNYKGLKTIEGKLYYFDSNGKMVTSKLISVDGKKYYMGKDGAAYKSKLISVSGKKYYIGPDCVAYKSKFGSIDGKKYYFGSDCAAVTSKLISVNGAKYYMGSDGVMYKSKLVSVDGKKYYLGSDGKAYKSKLISVDGKKYYLGTDCAAVTSKLVSVNGKKYYMGKDGVAYKKKLASVSGKKYYFGSDCAAYTKKLASVDGKKYYFGSDGAAVKNKVVSVDGKKYYFDSNCVMVKKKLVKVGSKKYYLGPDGVAYKSKFASVSGKKYYFGSDCAAYMNKTFSVNGVKWKADSNGVCTKR